MYDYETHGLGPSLPFIDFFGLLGRTATMSTNAANSGLIPIEKYSTLIKQIVIIFVDFSFLPTQTII
jgi:hypothetical protein